MNPGPDIVVVDFFAYSNKKGSFNHNTFSVNVSYGDIKFHLLYLEFFVISFMDAFMNDLDCISN